MAETSGASPARCEGEPVEEAEAVRRAWGMLRGGVVSPAAIESTHSRPTCNERSMTVSDRDRQDGRQSGKT